MSHSATIYIQSTPHFLMEAFILLVAFILTLFQHVNIINYSKKILRLKPHSIYCKTDREPADDNDSSTSIRKRTNQVLTTVAYQRSSLHSSKSQLGWIFSEHPDTDNDKKILSDELLSLTPEEYVKLEKEKKLREKELDNSKYSLSTLCQIAIKKQWSDSTFKKNLSALKENLECNSSSLEGKYLGHKTGMMTESLLCMLENLINNSSIDNPLPFKGNIATLAVDAAELIKTNPNEERHTANILQKKCDGGDSVILKSVNWADVVPQSEDLD
ncbi:hypothetical protein FQR65_LT03054 [Abscondita terminalis]|nr:hypothetical protein FQR65_LT03054 [Abscondita terminalis]